MAKKKPATMLIGARVKFETVERIDAIVAWYSSRSDWPRWSRSDVIRQLLLDGLERKEVEQGETEAREGKTRP